MLVSPTNGGETVNGAIAEPNVRQKTDFSHILNKQIAESVKHAHTAVSKEGLQSGNKASIAPGRLPLSTAAMHNPPISLNRLRTENDTLKGLGLVPLGAISKSNPTVSDLMVKHPTYGKDCWNILHSSINQNKPYTTIPKDSRIYLNPKTLEIVWNLPADTVNEPKAKNVMLKDAGNVFLGTLSKRNPTVSDLMVKHPAYGKDCWKILRSGINQNKPYTTIPKDSRIYLNPKTLEIVWDGSRSPEKTGGRANQPESRAKFIRPRKSNPFSDGLAKAVKPYLGKPYKEMNCFELVAQGLEGVGIRYFGRDGLGERLVKMATQKGLTSNHYLSGEGLIETSGSQIYSKSIPKIRNSKTEAHKVYQEVEPLLHKGLILSFSTPTRGHTGIISQREHNWTYINSGNMDHRIEGRASKGVGEEFLGAEIRNWFRLAANRREPLQITVGRLDEDKLKALLI